MTFLIDYFDYNYSTDGIEPPRYNLGETFNIHIDIFVRADGFEGTTVFSTHVTSSDLNDPLSPKGTWIVRVGNFDGKVFEEMCENIVEICSEKVADLPPNDPDTTEAFAEDMMKYFDWEYRGLRLVKRTTP